MISLKNIKIKNFRSIGGKVVDINFREDGLTLISGQNGIGKCVHRDTSINISMNDELKNLYDKWKS